MSDLPRISIVTPRRLEDIARIRDAGRSEVARIAEMQDLPRGPVARLKARLFKERVRLRSGWHVLRRRELPGALPGVGWDYDELWSARVAGVERSVPQG